MVNVKGPCYSVDAKGLLKGFILFSHYKRKNIVNFYRLHRDKKSYPRLAYRGEWGICVSRWRCATPEMKVYYTELGRMLNLGGNQFHMKEYFQLIRDNVCGVAICNVSRCG